MDAMVLQVHKVHGVLSVPKVHPVQLVQTAKTENLVKTVHAAQQAPLAQTELQATKA